ncbi:MAG TPA: sigma-70 family RNA polymerase sigma factor [Candidatus Limnocylindrales bacterium]|nr:sigma-70 family RNA polymerase sigma factor [Candidatus Limnocylindrales bacterium]
MDDRELVEAVTTGDRQAFRLLVDRESASIFRLCLRILGQVGEAEDAAQESFVIAYRALGTYRGDGPLGAWLARIAARHALRQLGRRREAVALESVAEPAAPGDRRIDPLAAALGAERQQAVRRAVASLPEPYRETVALRFFGELSLEEIATATGRPLNTVKTHLRRGLLRLRDALAREVAA